MDSMDAQVRYNDDWVPYPDQIPGEDILGNVAEFIELCQSSGIDVILYESPWYEKHCASQTKRNSVIQALADEKKVPWVNFNLDSALISEPVFFQSTSKNNQHLSKAGAEAVSIKLASVIQDRLESKP